MLDWQLKSPDDKVIANRVLSNQPLPEKFQNEPELWSHNHIFWMGFTELQFSRTIGMDQGNIPWTAMIAWCDRWGLDDDQTEDFVYIVQAMDQHALDFRNKINIKQREADARRNKQQQNSPTQRRRK